MVYWGCSTAQNRCVWAGCAFFAVAATVLLCAGSARMFVCNHSSAADLPRQEVGPCRVKAGLVMALCPVLVIFGVLPSLLFFQSCCAEPPPQDVDWEKDVPASGITVVRRTSAGASVYRYDSQGKLLQAPDCYRHTACRTPPSPAKLSSGGPWGPNWLAAEFGGGDVMHSQQHQRAGGSPAGGSSAPGSPAGRGAEHHLQLVMGAGGGGSINGVPSSPGRMHMPTHHQAAGGGAQLFTSSSSWGQVYTCNSSTGQHSRHGSIAEDEAATAEVHICLSPLSKGPSAGCDKK